MFVFSDAPGNYDHIKANERVVAFGGLHGELVQKGWKMTQFQTRNPQNFSWIWTRMLYSSVALRTLTTELTQHCTLSKKVIMQSAVANDVTGAIKKYWTKSSAGHAWLKQAITYFLHYIKNHFLCFRRPCVGTVTPWLRFYCLLSHHDDTAHDVFNSIYREFSEWNF